MKTTVLYHRADFDGLFCREIARKFLPDAELIGWDYGDPLILMPSDGLVYILDLSPDSLCDHPGLSKMIWNRIVWIDHHKTAIDKYPASISGYRIDGVAACRLAWQWFSRDPHDVVLAMSKDAGLPTKQDFIDRKVIEPIAVRLAGEYDILDKRDPDAELFQHGLRSQYLTDAKWNWMLTGDQGPDAAMPKRYNTVVEGLLADGRIVQYAKTEENKSIIKGCGFTVHFEGFCLLACNAARYNSQLFTAGLLLEHDGCLGFNWDGKQWRVSLYTDKPGIDLSPVAVKYGGGGHRGACGFRCANLPFIKL